MTSREIVKRAIHFQDPPRLPYNYDSNRMPVTEHFYGDDFIWCFLDPLTTRPEFDAEGRKVDEWGNVWATMGETFGEPIQYAYAGLENTQTAPAGLSESRLV